jgi:biotin carboxyl carrier protein
MMKYSVRVQGRAFAVEIAGEAPRYDITIDGRTFKVDAADLGDEALLTMLMDHESHLAHTRVADARRGMVDVSIGGKYRRLEVLDELTAVTQHRADDAGPERFVLAAPMPGLVVALHCAPGDAVRAGSPLVVMEAMKMQNELVSDVDGVVREVRVQLHQAVESGMELVVIEAG